MNDFGFGGMRILFKIQDIVYVSADRRMASLKMTICCMIGVV